MSGSSPAEIIAYVCILTVNNNLAKVHVLLSSMVYIPCTSLKKHEFNECSYCLYVQQQETSSSSLETSLSRRSRKL